MTTRMSIIIDDSSLDWLKNEQPLLQYNVENKIIKGIIQISMYYNPRTKKALIWDISEYQLLKESIIDSYEVSIDLSWDLPLVKETAWRIKALWEKQWLNNLDDLHINRDWSCCLMPANQLFLHLLEDNSLIWLFTNVIYPFFYSQSYYERYWKWIMWEFPHWWIGILVFFNKQNKQNKIRIFPYTCGQLNTHILLKIATNDLSLQWHTNCFCWSKNKIRYCHDYSTLEFKELKDFFSYIKSFNKKHLIKLQNAIINSLNC